MKNGLAPVNSKSCAPHTSEHQQEWLYTGQDISRSGAPSVRTTAAVVHHRLGQMQEWCTISPEISRSGAPSVRTSAGVVHHRSGHQQEWCIIGPDISRSGASSVRTTAGEVHHRPGYQQEWCIIGEDNSRNGAPQARISAGVALHRPGQSKSGTPQARTSAGVVLHRSEYQQDWYFICQCIKGSGTAQAGGMGIYTALFSTTTGMEAGCLRADLCYFCLQPWAGCLSYLTAGEWVLITLSKQIS